MSTDNTQPKVDNRTETEKQDEFLKQLIQLAPLNATALARGILYLKQIQYWVNHRHWRKQILQKHRHWRKPVRMEKNT
jgi:hypothetical protein